MRVVERGKGGRCSGEGGEGAVRTSSVGESTLRRCLALSAGTLAE